MTTKFSLHNVKFMVQCQYTDVISTEQLKRFLTKALY